MIHYCTPRCLPSGESGILNNDPFLHKENAGVLDADVIDCQMYWLSSKLHMNT